MSVIQNINAPIPPTPRVVTFNRVSEEDYFAMDLVAETRLEYYDGEVVARAGAQPAHNFIVANVLTSLHGRLRGSKCRVSNADQRVANPGRRGYFYPDVVAACGEWKYQPGTRPAALLNPALLIEVLSDSTERNDRSRKLRDYQSIPGLLYYVLLESERIGADLYAREPGTLVWTHRTFDLLADVLPLLALGIELPLAEAYAAVVFGEGEEAA